MNYVERKNCRACGSELQSSSLLDFGNQAIVDFLEEGEIGRGVAPLALVQCAMSSCGLLQLRHTVDADTLYRTFWYRSGINEQMRKALHEIVQDSQRYVTLRHSDAVCDIGSNDGTLLSFYPRGMKKVGFEPAHTLAMESLDVLDNSHIVEDYFRGREADKTISGKKFKIITAIAMFYDLDNPGAFLRDVASVLHNDGVFVVQMNYLGLMVRNLTFDNIGHEHLCYYSLSSLVPLFERAGLKIVDAETNDVNGGSLRVYARRKNGNELVVEDVVPMMLQEEREHLSPEAIKHFAERAFAVCVQLRDFLAKLRKSGKKVYAYGASTRGSTLLQTVFNGVDVNNYLEAVAERDTHKIGRRTAGTNLKIVSEDEARKKADYFLILPYHFWPSIAEREKEWLRKGGKAILPVPFPRVIELTEISTGKSMLASTDLMKDLETVAR